MRGSLRGCADPDFFVMGFTQLDVVMNIKKAARLSFLIQPDQRPLDDEEYPHGLRMLVGYQGMTFSRRFVDEVSGRRGPVVLQIAPFTGDRVGKDFVRVIVAIHQTGALRHQNIAPPVLGRRYPKWTGRDGLGKGYVVALIIR